jgi:3-hydroxyisobutyrate dehydrogenase-like beta-hydroxyacid dehydrogenase
MEVQRIGIVGYGEVGKIFAAGLRPQVAQLVAWDLKFAQAATAEAEQGHAQARGVRACRSMQELCEAIS